MAGRVGHAFARGAGASDDRPFVGEFVVDARAAGEGDGEDGEKGDCSFHATTVAEMVDARQLFRYRSGMSRFLDRLLIALIVVACLGLLVLVAKSGATTIVAPAGSPFQRWVDEAKVPTPEVTLTVVETPGPHGCPGRTLDYPACTAEQTVWISQEAQAPRQVFLHELGHNVDALMPEWMRARFMAIMGLTGPWRLEGEPAPLGPNELFANVYAECAVKPYVRPGWHNGPGPIYGRDPYGGVDRHDRVCRMLARL